jgi:hypothetical protein
VRKTTGTFTRRRSFRKTGITPLRIHKYGRITSGGVIRGKTGRKARLARVHTAAFALPDQRLFPRYYQASRRWSAGPDMKSRIKGGKTVQQGSPWGSRLKGGKTDRGGSPFRSHIRPGSTVQGGSRWAGHIVPGRTVKQGSRWGSTMRNWRFSGYAAPMRPKGVRYYRAKRRTRSPWASRLR